MHTSLPHVLLVTQDIVTSALFVTCNQLMTTFFSPDNI